MDGILDIITLGLLLSKILGSKLELSVTIADGAADSIYVGFEEKIVGWPINSVAVGLPLGFID